MLLLTNHLIYLLYVVLLGSKVKYFEEPTKKTEVITCRRLNRLPDKTIISNFVNITLFISFTIILKSNRDGSAFILDIVLRNVVKVIFWSLY